MENGHVGSGWKNINNQSFVKSTVKISKSIDEELTLSCSDKFNSFCLSIKIHENTHTKKQCTIG